MRRLRGAALPLAAQALFTLAQVSVTITGSIALHPDDWGRFALLLSVFFIATAFVRGFSSLPILVYLSGDEQQARRAKWAGSVSGLLAAVPAFGVLTGAGALVGAAEVGALLGTAMLSHSLYDTARAVEMASGAFARIVAADAVLLVALTAGSALSLVPGASPGVLLPLAMTGAYACAAVMLSIGHRPSTRWTVRMFASEYGRDAPFLALDGALLASVLGSFVIITGATTSLSEAGAFRTCLTLLVGPLQAVQNSLSPLAIRSLRESAKASGDPGGVDTRRATLRQPLTFIGAGLASGTLYGSLLVVATFALLLAVDLPVIEAAAPYSFSASVLVSALWASSILSSFMRYRRPNSELTLVRVATLAASLSLFATWTIALRAEPSTALLISSVAVLALPATHTLLRWGRVTRSFSPPATPSATNARGQTMPVRS